MRRTSSCLDEHTSERGSSGRLQERSSAFLDMVSNPLDESIVGGRYLRRLDSWMRLIECDPKHENAYLGRVFRSQMRAYWVLELVQTF